MEQEGLEESVLRQRLRFQQLICDVSNHFINLPVEEIDQHIKEALGNSLAFSVSTGQQSRNSPSTARLVA